MKISISTVVLLRVSVYGCALLPFSMRLYWTASPLSVASSCNAVPMCPQKLCDIHSLFHRLRKTINLQLFRIVVLHCLVIQQRINPDRP